MTAKPYRHTPADFVAAYEAAGSIQGAATALGTDDRTVRRSLRRSGNYIAPGNKTAIQAGRIEALEKCALPAAGEVKRYIVTSAQNGTRINKGFFASLQNLAAYYAAQIIVCPWTYSPMTGLSDTDEEPAWDQRIAPFLTTKRTQLAPGLILCAEISRILPTASRPLSGFETYTGRASSIIPHAKIALESVASMKHEPTKFLYTTGAVTQPHYSRTKAGFKGEHHHSYGALLVEVTRKGWWVRQLNADRKNHVHDLDVKATPAEIVTGLRAEAVVVGDLHVAEADPIVLKATWGLDGLMDTVLPQTQVLHDVFDMRSRPWQDELNFHRNFEKFVASQENVEAEVKEARAYLQKIRSLADKTVVVRANHDLKLEKWLNTADYRKDLTNAHFFLRMQLAKVEAITRGDGQFKVLEHALALPWVHFLDEDQSFLLCPDASGGGIECGNHGHLGPNGSRGTPIGLSKLARKQIIGDKHVACILEGVYVVGTCALNPAYTRGPSAWSPTHCVVYPNGKRALVTCWGGRFFAPRPKSVPPKQA